MPQLDYFVFGMELLAFSVVFVLGYMLFWLMSLGSLNKVIWYSRFKQLTYIWLLLDKSGWTLNFFLLAKSVVSLGCWLKSSLLGLYVMSLIKVEMLFWIILGYEVRLDFFSSVGFVASVYSSLMLDLLGLNSSGTSEERLNME